MALVIEVEGTNDNATSFLSPYLQSGNLNFLIGSGASFPAIATAGSIETEIDALLLSGDNAAADAKCVQFIESTSATHAEILNGSTNPNVISVAASYARFVALVDHLLFARKSALLPRQATIFTTNYDIFIENAASTHPGLVLNDGFDRTAGTGMVFPLAPERYFDRTFRSSGIYASPPQRKRAMELGHKSPEQIEAEMRELKARIFGSKGPPSLPE